MEKPTHCPLCASPEIEANSSDADIDLRQVVVPVHCNTCGASWSDLYRFVGPLDGSLEIGSDVVTREYLHRMGGHDSNEHGTPDGPADVILDRTYYCVPYGPSWTLKRVGTGREGCMVALVTGRAQFEHLVLGLGIDIPGAATIPVA